jgi:beta-1,4-galactosyltransferase 1
MNKKNDDYIKKFHEYKINRKYIDINIIEDNILDNSKSTSNIAIIIPHRNRLDHLKLFIEHFNKLDTHNNNVDIYIIDQNNADLFNRGLLLNIGFEISSKSKKYDRYILHDVDSYPEQILFDLYFKHLDKIIHFASPYLGYKYTTFSFFGGVIGMDYDTYKKINGYSNSFFGHGGEDDSMYNRIVICDIKNLWRPSKGKYHLIDHDEPTNLEYNKTKKKNVIDDLTKWKHDGLHQLKNIFINIKKYDNYNDFVNKYDVENSNIINKPTEFNKFIDTLTESTISTISTISDEPNNNINYFFYKIDYLAKHKYDTHTFLDNNIINREIDNANKKKLERELKNKHVEYNKYDKSYVSVIYPIIDWNEVEEKIINTYTTPKLYDTDKKYNKKIKKLVKNQFKKYTKNLTKDDLFNTLKHIFDNYNEVLYFRIRNGKIECQYHLYNPTNKKDWYKDLKYSLNNKLTNVDNAFADISQKSNKEYYTLRKPHYMASNNCLLSGNDEYAYWEGNPTSYVDSFKEMFEYIVTNFDAPDCDILINRKDFSYLRKDGKYGYDHLTDDKIDENITFYPLGSQASTKDNLDIPIVSADEWEFSKSKESKETESKKTKEEDINKIWNSKKSIAVFRGKGTGCSVSLSNPRIKLSQISYDWNNDNDKKNLIDVKLSSLVTSRIKAYNKLIGMTDYRKFKHLEGKFMTTEEQLQYKYVFNIEGNSQAYRFSSQFYKGLVITVKSKYKMWFEKLIKPNKHFIEVENDYSNLYETIQYLKNHDDEAKQIYKNGIKFANKYTSKKILCEYMFYYMYYLNKYVM